MKKFYTCLMFFFLYAPILVLIVFSFNSSSSLTVFEGFSLTWYRRLFQDRDILSSLYNTAVLAVSSSVIATLIGTAAAVGIFKFKNRVIKDSVMSVTSIPMMNPDIVTGISLMLLFVFVGKMLNLVEALSFWTMLIAHITFNLPYVILSVMPKLKQMDKHLPEAALDLGCTPLRSFFKVELPIIMPGVFTGFIMAFTLSLDDFVISYFTSGSSFVTLPVQIFSMTRRNVKPDMYALSALICAAILILLIIINFMSDRDERAAKKKIKLKGAKN